MKRNLLTILISLALLLIMGECCAFAEEQIQMENVTWVNPMYANLPQAEIPKFRRPLTVTRDGDAETIEELVGMVRQKLADRVGYYDGWCFFTVKYVDSELKTNIANIIKSGLFEHTGVSNEGDYLFWHVHQIKIEGSISPNTATGVYKYQINVTVEVYSGPDEEQTVAQEVASTLAALDLEGLNDYEKVAAIYGYICDHVSYNYTYYTDPLYYPMYSAYAAIHDGTAVCQGIAQLMYRMLLEEGIDCRLIAGMADGSDETENHAWNIVKIGNEYFNLDATWDLGASGIEDFDYFLQTDAAFENGGVHKRGTDGNGLDYSGEAFYAAYPMGCGGTIEEINLLADGTAGIEICVGAEDIKDNLFAYTEIEEIDENNEIVSSHYSLADTATFYGTNGRIMKSFVVRKAPKEMMDPICVKLYDGDGNRISLYDKERSNVTENGFVTCVYEGIEETADHDPAYAAVMNDLGSSAQRYFGYDAENAAPLLGSLSNITAGELACYAESTAGILPQGLEYAGGTLELDETVTMNFLFYGDTEGVTFKVGETTVTPESNGDYTVVSVSGLTAKDLADAHTITAADGVNSYTITASALSYVYKALTEQTDADLQELARALYAWWASCN